MSSNGSKKTTSPTSQRLWTFTFVCLVVIAFFGSISANGVHNGIAILIEAAGEPSSLTGLVICCFSFTALLTRPIVGNLSDAYGRKIIIAAGAGFLLVGCILALLTDDILSLVPSRILMAIGFSAVITVGAAATADVLPPERLGEGLGYQNMSYAVAMALGPMMAIALAQQGRFQLFVVFALFAICTFLLILPCKLPQIPKKSGGGSPSPVGQTLANKTAIEGGDLSPVSGASSSADSSSSSSHPVSAADSSSSEGTSPAAVSSAGVSPAEPHGIWRILEKSSIKPAIITVLVYLPMAVYMSYMALYTTTQGIEGINAFFIVAAVVMVLIRLVAGKAFDRLPVNTLLVPALIAGGLGFVFPLLFNNMPALILSSVCYGLFCGIAQPLLVSECIRRAPDYRRGAASATFYVGNDLGYGGGAALWGVVIAAFGFQVTFIACIVISIAAILASLVLLKQ